MESATVRAVTQSQLQAGTARVDITGSSTDQIDDPLYAAVHTAPDPGTDRLYVRALVLLDKGEYTALITVDAVAIGEIGSISNEYLPDVRVTLQQEFGIQPRHVIINASHCHGVVCADVESRTVQAVREAMKGVVPVTVGVGRGYEDGIMENRRMMLRNGREADVRRAYGLPADDEIDPTTDTAGLVDPEIGILRLDRAQGGTLALVFNFACHPIQGVPGGGNTADLSGFAAQVIENGLGQGAVALFVQGCAADINPLRYRDIDTPPDAEPMGRRLGLSTLRAAQEIRCEAEGAVQLVDESIALPKADLAPFIEALKTEQTRLLQALQPTSLNLKSFIPLQIKYSLSPQYPSFDAHAYLHEEKMGRTNLRHLDETNRARLDQYCKNVYIMEELTRLGVNLGLLRMHHARNCDSAGSTVEAEMTGLRVGSFALLTFAGELPVAMGLNVKRSSPHDYTFVAGVTNGYLYYTPTDEQLRNRGGAQEDSDCFVAAGWQKLFEDKALAILQKL